MFRVCIKDRINLAGAAAERILIPLIPELGPVIHIMRAINIYIYELLAQMLFAGAEREPVPVKVFGCERRWYA